MEINKSESVSKSSLSMESPKDVGRPTGRFCNSKTSDRFEFSKIVFIILCAVTMGVTLYSMLIMWKTDNVGPLTYLIPSVYTAFATGTGFYFDKAKKENLIKLRSIYGDEMMDKVKGDS